MLNGLNVNQLPSTVTEIIFGYSSALKGDVYAIYRTYFSVSGPIGDAFSVFHYDVLKNDDRIFEGDPDVDAYPNALHALIRDFSGNEDIEAKETILNGVVLLIEDFIAGKPVGPSLT